MKTLQQVEPRTPISSVHYTINQGGSYYLTTNLIAVAEQHGITVSADNVTLDLSGFEIVGVSGPSSVVSGIRVTPSRTNIVVRNGTLRNWLGYGVNADGSGGRFDNLSFVNIASRGILAPYAIVNDCRFEKVGFGITVGSRSTVKNCVIIGATFDGISSSDGCLIFDSVIEICGGYGISAGNGSIVRGCKVEACGHSGAGTSGVSVGSDSIIESTVSRGNGRFGFAIGNGSILKHCAADNNLRGGVSISSGAGIVDSCTVRSNHEFGIDAGTETTILNCNVSTNIGYGIFGAANLTVKGCIVSRNASNGIQTGDNSLIAHCLSFRNSSNGIQAASACTLTQNTANENARNGIVVHARSRVFGNTANNNGGFTTNGAGFYFSGDNNHIEANTSVHNYVGYNIAGSSNLVVRNAASDFGIAGFSVDLPSNREAPIVQDPTSADPWANVAY